MDNAEKVVDLIVKSAERLATAVKLSRRDEKWWAFLTKEDWNLINLSWALRGVILKRGKGEEAGLELDDKAKKQIEEILKGSEGGISGE
ncbi:hypothetical protein ES708_32839 [subsurface metagenome]